MKSKHFIFVHQHKERNGSWFMCLSLYVLRINKIFMTKPLCDTCLVIVAMDCLTKFAKLWALKTSIKECVVWFIYERMSWELELLLKWFLIVSFKSWMIFVGYLAIKHSITTPYMHSANGLVKHMNKTLCSRLWKEDVWINVWVWL
jgi:hypothetical protein